VDFFTFVIIGIVIYSFFSKKGKAPQRTRRPQEQTSRQPEPQQASRTTGKKKEGFFESIERQIRESAEALEKELQTGRSENPAKRTEKIPEKIRRDTPPKPAVDRRSYEGVEGAWGTEGRSDYHRSQSKQGRSVPDSTSNKKLGWREEESAIAQDAIEKAGAYQPKSLERALGFSSSEVVQGVIWAEILQEPRAKRPFASSRR
jgi:hypothetical protein